MPKNKGLVPVGKIEGRILLIRGEKVIVDADLAKFYAVPTKRLKEQVKKNKCRFPQDFMFQLSEEEKIGGGRKLRPPFKAQIFQKEGE